jgi:hypothetical protein
MQSTSQFSVLLAQQCFFMPTLFMAAVPIALIFLVEMPSVSGRGQNTYLVTAARYAYQGLYPRSKNPSKQQQVHMTFPNLCD